ncbi:hypothetical protein MSPP1_003544 [Malassezia sp. CBS 17886]|nr:hypothetical protein MSPP1_003544 [Malassezia sp. CBS 17886]
MAETQDALVVSGCADVKTTVESMTLLDIAERVPPSMIQLLVLLGPTVDAVHRFLVLATWRGGVTTHIASWTLVAAWVLVCLYGYEVLRYAPQALPLAWIAYTWVRGSFARVSGRRSADGAAVTATVKTVIAQVCDISDFFAAVYSGALGPALTLLTWTPTNPAAWHIAVFLVASWPLWLLSVFPRHLWITPIYMLCTSVRELYASPAVRAVRAYVAHTAAPRAVDAVERHLPRVAHALVRASAAVHVHVLPHACGAVHWLRGAVRTADANVSVQLFPPFPVAAFSVRHMLLVAGVVALTWCSPWATLLRAAVWRSALVRHATLGLVRVLSGAASPGEMVRAALPKRLSAMPPAASRKRVQSHETLFQFDIFENQRWWIGLDWTAALLPQERPSWSDSNNHAVAPPSSFMLPAPLRMYVPSTTHPGYEDCRYATWQWVDPEWRVAGAQGITSSTYTPQTLMHAADAQRLSDEHVAQGSAAELPPSLRALVHAAGSTDPDCDIDGWQYGDNAWEKLGPRNGMGKYTRRRCWVRRAVLVVSVAHGERKK